MKEERTKRRYCRHELYQLPDERVCPGRNSKPPRITYYGCSKCDFRKGVRVKADDSHKSWLCPECGSTNYASRCYRCFRARSGRE